MCHYLEHTVDMRAELQAAHTVLEADGYLLLRCPIRTVPLPDFWVAGGCPGSNPSIWGLHPRSTWQRLLRGRFRARRVADGQGPSAK